MGKIKTTIVVILVFTILLTIAVIAYICMRLLGRRNRKENEEQEDENEVDPERLALQKAVIEKTPLAAEENVDFDNENDDSLIACKMGMLLFL